MKISQLAATAAAIVIMSTLASNRVHAGSSTFPSIPVGSLSTSDTIVRAGTNTSLSWNITYPSLVQDYVKVDDPATVTTKSALDVEIRVIGAGVTSSRADGSNMSFVPTEAQLSVGGGSYQRIFYGTNNDVDPNKIVYSGSLSGNKSLRFGGRYFFNNVWSKTYTSTTGTQNVRTLVNGQTPPTAYSLVNSPTLESFIKPYLDSTGKVSIGPMDVIVFMELTHTDAQKNELGYDLQDMVLLVTFKTKN